MAKNTRGAQGAGTIRKKTVTRNGKDYTYWEARVTVGRDSGTGKQIQKSFSGKTQKEVREKMQAAAVDVNNNAYVEPSKMTVAQWLDIWLDGLYTQKFKTVEHYKSVVNNHLKPNIGAIRLQDLSKSDIDKLYQKLLTNGNIKTHQPLSKKSVKNIHVVLKAAIGAAVDNDHLKRDPMRKIKMKNPPAPQIHTLDDEQIKEYLKAVENDALSLVLKFILFTGVRESEAIGLTWDCVDFKKGQITIRQQLQDFKKENGGMKIVETKNDRWRVITPAPYVMQLLKVQEAKQIDDKTKVGHLWQGWKDDKERAKALVFTNELGTYHRPKTIYMHNKKILNSIGIENVTVHDLRHTFAVVSLQNGDDVKTLQSNLGHATAAFTLDVYGHVSENMKNASSSRMQDYIEKMTD